MLIALRRLMPGAAQGVKQADQADVSGSLRRLWLYKQVVEDNLVEGLNLQRLADVGGVTRFQVIRDFKKISGVTPATFIRDRRHRYASDLSNRGAGIAEAALQAGFADQSHLTRTFRVTQGITPGKFMDAVDARSHLTKKSGALNFSKAARAI